MSRLSLVPYDSPVLRGHAYKVQKVDKHIRYIMDGLVETCYETNPRCFALSAPQIGISKRIIVVPYHDQLIPIANPRIIKMSGLQRYIEGCGTVDLNPSI
ncbi:MAG: peptide deformylase, partial [Bacilli bacterium]